MLFREQSSDSPRLHQLKSLAAFVGSFSKPPPPTPLPHPPLHPPLLSEGTLQCLLASTALQKKVVGYNFCFAAHPAFFPLHRQMSPSVPLISVMLIHFGPPTPTPCWSSWEHYIPEFIKRDSRTSVSSLPAASHPQQQADDGAKTSEPKGTDGQAKAERPALEHRFSAVRRTARRRS